MAKKDRSEYQREYYLKNKEKLSRRKKERYNSNPDVKRRILENSLAYRIRKNAEIKRLISEGKLEPKERKPYRSRWPLKIEVNGEIKDAYGLFEVAKRINRNIHSVQSWVRSGTIPQTPLRTRYGTGLYTDDMILAMRVVFDASGVIGKNPRIRERIIEGWKDLGICVEEGDVG